MEGHTVATWTDADYIRTVQGIAQDTITKYPKLGVKSRYAIWCATLSIAAYMAMEADVLAEIDRITN
jgi:hypothetical protein